MTNLNSSNPLRRAVGGIALNSRREVDRDLGTSAPPPFLQVAVVYDIIFDRSIMDDEYKNLLRELVSNYELIETAPVGSVIARLISNNQGTSATPFQILLPLFSSHMQLPVHVGEQVHVIYPDLHANQMKIGYWISRIHSVSTVEDANYTHSDRRYDPLNNPANWSIEQLRSVVTSPPPNFPNGGDTIDTYTIRPSPNRNESEGQSTNPYDQMLQASKAFELESREVVPRFRKRPQDFVLQGSNNSMIVMGEDRAGPVNGAIEGEELDSKGFAGTIDMVAGRGRFFPENADTDPELTAPRVIENSREYLETDKAPYRNKAAEGGRKQDNSAEGDPDFINDAARLYVTMQSEVDNKFGITDIDFPENTLPIAQPTNENGSGTINRSYVVGKADHVRLVARKDSERSIEGTILILREGLRSDGDEDQDLSYVYIDKNGMNLEAKKIFLGKGSHEDPNENDNINYNDDEGPYEPYILWSKYKDTVDSLQNQITELHNKHEESMKAYHTNMENLLQAISTALSANNCIPYGQNPAITAMKAIIESQRSTLKTTPQRTLSNFKSDLDSKQDSNNNDNVSKKNHSQKIYGE